MSLFLSDPDLTRQITFVDLVFACVLTFIVTPAVAFALGYSLLFATNASEPAPLWIVAGVFTAFGYTGILAWAATPIALLAGWWATRTGRLAWGTALLAGAVGGALFSLPFIGTTDVRLIGREFLTVLAAFAGTGALYGLIGFTALRWLRADILSRKA